MQVLDGPAADRDLSRFHHKDLLAEHVRDPDRGRSGAGWRVELVGTINQVGATLRDVDEVDVEDLAVVGAVDGDRVDHPAPILDLAIELLVATARRLKDRELAEALDAALVMKRAKEGGTSVPAHVRANFERLASYVSTAPGPWDGGSGSTGGLATA